MTAREPSAVEVIAEDALVARVKRVTGHVPVGFRDLLHVLMHPDVVDYTLAALKAAGFMVATREQIRSREGDAWDGALNEMHDLGWMHDGALTDGFARNPYRGLIDADVTRDHEEDER